MTLKIFQMSFEISKSYLTEEKRPPVLFVTALNSSPIAPWGYGEDIWWATWSAGATEIMVTTSNIGIRNDSTLNIMAGYDYWPNW